MRCVVLADHGREVERHGKDVEQFTQLLVRNRLRIHAFILTLVHDHQAAEDVFQEVSSMLWRKFDEFQPGPQSDFAVWAMTVARYRVLEWRRSQQKLPLKLSDDVWSQLADETLSVNCDYEERHAALRQCISKLPTEDRRLLVSRFVEGTSVVSIAKSRNRSRVAIHNRLSKLRSLLLDCIRVRISEGWHGLAQEQ